MNKNQFIGSSLSILFLLLLSITGCGSLKMTSFFNPQNPKLGKYKAIEIPDLETEIPNVPNAALTRIPDEVTKQLISKNVGFQEIERGSIENIPQELTLVLVGEIVGYESGKSFKKEGGALKFGEASLTVHIWLLDKATGNELTSGEVSGLSTIGFLKSGYITEGVYEAIAKETVKFISQNY
ncbi:MAG: hypothetical protein L0Y68_04020 [Candidatus Dadabacteria bacterium]|nr:hypothetical protein [Candidatus Dadabacteria bacterium]